MTLAALHDWPLPYVSALDRRDPAAVDLVVMHCTELPDLAMARNYGEQIHYAAGTGNSGHFYIDRDGAIWRYVEGTRIAHHTHGHNARSIGIELVNRGRYPHWLDSRHQAMTEAYADAQIDALLALLDDLAASFPGLRFIAGHEDLDTRYVEASDDASLRVARKSDPGPLFPWARVLAHGRLQRLQAPDPGASPP